MLTLEPSAFLWRLWKALALTLADEQAAGGHANLVSCTAHVPAGAIKNV